MRGIKVGNFLMYRNSRICLIIEIISNGENAPSTVIGIDSNQARYEGTAGEWSPIIGKSEQLKEFSNAIFNKFLQGKETKGCK